MRGWQSDFRLSVQSANTHFTEWTCSVVTYTFCCHVTRRDEPSSWGNLYTACTSCSLCAWLHIPLRVAHGNSVCVRGVIPVPPKPSGLLPLRFAAGHRPNRAVLRTSAITGPINPQDSAPLSRAAKQRPAQNPFFSDTPFSRKTGVYKKILTLYRKPTFPRNRPRAVSVTSGFMTSGTKIGSLAACAAR